MTIDNLNLLSVLLMSLTCAISIACNPPAVRMLQLNGLHAAGSSVASLLRSARVNDASREYALRHITQTADGINQYYRFTIKRVRGSYRAYIDSAPQLGQSPDQLGASADGSGFYIDAGRGASAADAERSAKQWANTWSAQRRITEL